MATTKTKEVRGLGEKEALSRLVELKKELMTLRAQASAGTPPKSPGLIKSTKRGIARIMTMMREKELEGLSSEKEKKEDKKGEGKPAKKETKEKKSN